jgi:hypothetical protein
MFPFWIVIDASGMPREAAERGCVAAFTSPRKAIIFMHRLGDPRLTPRRVDREHFPDLLDDLHFNGIDAICLDGAGRVCLHDLLAAP